jgi:hypothetical protein
MIAAIVLTTLGLLIILWDLNWTWIRIDSSIEFIHSLIGVISIGLAVLQVVASISSESDSKFNLLKYKCINKSIGMITLIFGGN